MLPIRQSSLRMIKRDAKKIQNTLCSIVQRIEKNCVSKVPNIARSIQRNVKPLLRNRMPNAKRQYKHGVTHILAHKNSIGLPILCVILIESSLDVMNDAHGKNDLQSIILLRRNGRS